ncbi:MAG TPA: bifunctional phosphopantothenoylcysteine decarboxylase/phosphopantothenate--cysteine ligase CoaBC [Steroidobacteraceae bacterium]|jgi:phosphopantothenoylcysteine decarboxylase/phosphopantothenate--cysteine ligase|nr:bifunctional phosphopantothenoylcysteine decarboxylase/phosphopantothenate--cysteine ligase CoaBC [Steroidobacteraceae bacterium]
MSGKRIVLGVTGGIAAYKSPDIVRRLVERGAEVQVVMTAGALEFVTPMTFQAVSGREVRSGLWDETAERAMSHIELARWADLILIAPATADFLAHLTHGLADDLLTTMCLASSAPIAVAPAMNHVMWSNPATQANVAKLRERGVHVFGPASGSQACGETGEGRMLEAVDLAAAALGALPTEGPLSGKQVLITAGPTRERIDPVRFISNRSSGKMGYAVAQAARELGATVTLVSGPVNLPTPYGVKRIDVECAAQMHAAVMEAVRNADIFIGTAAVADYRPASPANCKIKKTTDKLDLYMERTIDILHTVAQLPDRPYVVGFAAETDNVEENARAKLVRKNLDLIAANEVGDCKVFEQDDNALVLLWPDGRKELGSGPKTELARKLMAFISERYLARNA